MKTYQLTVKYDLSVQKTYEYYAQAKRRVFAVLEALDSKKRLILGHHLRQVEQRSGKLPKGQRWFLMSKVFELTPSQIAEIEGLENADSVNVLIARVSDQLRAGEIELFPITELEALEAKKRLDTVRERRRKHRQNNLERLREYERNHARKKALSK